MQTSIGVRKLVEFTLKKGNLISSVNSQNTALDGINIHQQLQKKFSKDTQAEFSLKKELLIDGESWILHGRADGLKCIDDIPSQIIEIKTSSLEFEELSANTLELYWAQAKIYAHIIMEKEGLSELSLKLIYVQTTTNVTTEKIQVISKNKAKDFFNEVIESFTNWIKLQHQLKKERDLSINNLDFPFSSYRQNQYEFATAVYKTIALNKKLLVEAPTGTGKTISTIFPAIKALGTSKCQKIFYLTAKQSTRQVAEETLQLLVDHGLSISTITLTSKEQITFAEEIDIPDDENPYYLGYYDRLRPALMDILTNEKIITRQVIETYAKKHLLDPFEFSLDVSNFCDLIICDYNYLFDPLVKLQRFFTEKNYGYTFLIDEAHNLIDRSRAMYTKEISSEEVKNLLDKLHSLPQPPQEVVNKLNTLLNAFDLIKEPLLNYQQQDVIIEEKLSSITKKLMYFCDFVTEWLKENPEFSLKDELLELFFTAYTFVKVSDYYTESFRTHLLITKNSELLIRVFCLDSSSLIANSLNLGGSAVLFSATLSPLNYYQEMFGLIDDSLLYQLTSPFNESNLNLLITSYIPVTYQQRQHSLTKIITAIYTMITAKTGNYLVFLPSYTFLKQVVVAFNQAYPHVDTIIQETNMTRMQQEEFLKQFVSNPSKVLLGFAVLGGSFAEGIDLKGDRLNGVAIVSVGLPMLNSETNELKEYFDNKQKNGFQYAYQLPGLNNIFQAAGRVIRSSTDIGVVLLIDSRFSTARYTQFFPPHWKYAHVVHNKLELQNNLFKFWDNKNTGS